jgi:hypothetical protein
MISIKFEDLVVTGHGSEHVDVFGILYCCTVTVYTVATLQFIWQWTKIITAAADG